MLMGILFKVHDWLAHRVKWIQYPNIRQIKNKPDWQPYKGSLMVQIERHSGKSRLSGTGAIAMFAVGLVNLIVAIPIILIGGVFIYVILSELL